MFTRRQLLQSGSMVLGAGVICARVQASPITLLPSVRLRHDSAFNASFPENMRLRIVARSGEPPLKGKSPWHAAPDGGACFACDDGGWIYVSNSEMSDHAGGASALRFSVRADLMDCYRILSGTTRNCAGGATPWNSWLSCEESGDAGQVYECDPFGRKAALVRPSLGAFNHEAVAVDRQTGMLYLTEDQPDGCLYRFVPDQPQDLHKGSLQVAVMEADRLAWVALPDAAAQTTPARYQISHAARFAGGEGIVWQAGSLFFTTKYDNRVWSYNTVTHQLGVVYDAAKYKQPVLTGVDNICASANGDLIVAEDGGDMQVVVVPVKGEPFVLLTLHGQAQSEITGVAWSPDYSRLYFSSQRGSKGEDGDGITYELRVC